jgi:uncharacterized protein YraI
MRQQASARLVPVRLTLLMVIPVVMAGLVSAIALPAQLVSADPASTSSDLNLRSGPGDGYDILSVVPIGAAISVDGDAVDGFFPATYNGVSGWVSASYVVAGAPAPVSGYDTATTTYQPDPNTTYYDAGTVVVYETDAGANQQRGNRRNRDRNQPPTTTTTTAAAPDAAPDTAIANPGAPASNEQEIVSIIHQAANAYGQNPDDMVRVARCESSLNPRAVDNSGSYHGLFQFVPSTFAATPYGGQDIYDPWANAHAAAWMWSEGRKFEWVCQ